ncbi:MAG: CDP-glycerol glycerophosphotransferase family protein [Ruminococcus sp.]
MMKRMKNVWKKVKPYLLMSWYTMFFYRAKVKKEWIFIDSVSKKSIGSSMFQIAREITGNEAYGKYHVFIACNNESQDRIKALIQRYQMSRVSLMKKGGFQYAKVAARAGFLFIDGSLPNWYTKREEQILTNTWHGTPLYKLGKDNVRSAYDMGSEQRSLLMADYRLCASDYMKDIMNDAYFADNLFRGKILKLGTPGNVVFFDKERREDLRKQLKLDGKKVYGYMPAFRGRKAADPVQYIDQLEYYFTCLDQKMKKDEVLYVQLHPLTIGKVNYKAFKRIRPFPKGYETYDFLNVCDCLITDYSEVIFDFACSGRKMILFHYDYELYMAGRETYVPLQDFPFPKVRRIEDLYEEMEKPGEYDDAEFLQKYCQYENGQAAADVCRHIIKGEKALDEEKAPDNGKENVLLYAGGMGRNGITTAMLSLLEHLDLDKRNYYIAFRSGYLKKEPERVCMIPDKVGYLPIPNMVWESLGEKIAQHRYFNKNQAGKGVLRKVDRFYSRVYQRYFGHCPLDWVIHFFGYEKETINMFLHASAGKMIFVHNDMLSEIKTKGNQHELTVRRAYADYDRVVPVTEDIYGFTRELGKSADNLFVVNNCHDYQRVLKRAEQPLHFDSYTESTFTREKLEQVLESDVRKIITIGRFSREKGHDLLLKAFDRYHKENPDSYLIIIGGYGPIYEETKAMAASLSAADHIIIIKAISNPMPILKRCDVFVLSSRYEALGLVILEADTLGIPVISTDIPGPRGFMTENGGYLVPLSENGVYGGLKAFDEGRVKPMNVDYEAYNRKAVAEFEGLF